MDVIQAKGREPFEQVIVMPTKNRLALLKRAVESVVSQGYSPWRLVIVNDGSTDGTRAYLDDLAKHDTRIEVIHHEKSRGVNAARNAAFGTLKGHEYVSFLDDDDYFAPGALSVIAETFRALPPHISGVFFNTFLIVPDATRSQGFIFDPGEPFCDLLYADIMTKSRISGDCHPVFRAALFTGYGAYRYSEDINGYESEVLMRMMRDGVAIRCFPAVVKYVDRAHSGEHLSNYAVRRDRASFTRVHLRIFRDHKVFFAQHPRIAMNAAFGSCRVALGSLDFVHTLVFAGYYLQGFLRLTFSGHSQE